MNDQQKFPLDRGKHIFKNLCLDVGRVLILCNFVKNIFKIMGRTNIIEIEYIDPYGNEIDIFKENKPNSNGSKKSYVKQHKGEHIFSISLCLASYCVKELLNFVHIDGSIAYIFDVTIVPTNGKLQGFCILYVRYIGKSLCLLSYHGTIGIFPTCYT